MILFDKGSYEIITFGWVRTTVMSMTTFKSLCNRLLVNLSALLRGYLIC